MKLIIQIPCHNEEKTLPITLKELPNKINGIEQIETLIINDGSTDFTEKVAKEAGVNHILNLPIRCGLAEAFKKGIDRSLELGADIIVNTDGDNQYKGEYIAKLIEPILSKKAEIVIGCRDISKIKHFSFVKKILQKIGSSVVRKLSKTNIPDTTSGFRAYSRDAALKLNVFSTYTYTIETIIQAGRKEIPLTYITVSTNEKLRESRLIKSIPSYIMRSIFTMMRICLMYDPLKTFLKISVIPIFISSIFIVRFIVAHFTRPHGGHIQSLIIAAIGFIIGVLIIMIGFLGDIISANRRLSEEILYRIKKDSFEKK